MPFFLLIALSSVVLTSLAALRVVMVTAQLTEAVEVVDSSPWEGL